MSFVKNMFIKILLVIFLVAFVIFYPMLISIYVFMPLMVGTMGYLFISGIEKYNIYYILIAFLYLTNLELNLSLPLFLSIVSVLIVYVFAKNSFLHKIKCKVCYSLMIVILIDIIYLGLLLLYDFVFQTTTIVVDELLLYSLIVDLLVVVLL